MPVAPGGGIPFGASVRVFSKDYANPRIYTTNVQFEHQLATDFTVYFDFTHSQGVHLTRFININRTGSFAATPLFPTLGDIFVTSAVGKSNYNGFTAGVRKRLSKRYQFEGNYVLSKDKDDDSNERDPFTDRSFNLVQPDLDYSVSDRDIRHKFNFYSFVEIGLGTRGKFPCAGSYSATDYTGVAHGLRQIAIRLRKDNALLLVRLGAFSVRSSSANVWR